MAIRSYRPTTNGRRGMTTLVNEDQVLDEIITTFKVK